MDQGKCACGCGEKTSIYRGAHRRFIAGHHARGEHNGRYGKTVSAETRVRLSKGVKRASVEGRIPTHIPGWKHTEASRQKMSAIQLSPDHKPHTPRRGVYRKCQGPTCGRTYYVNVSRAEGTKFCSRRCLGQSLVGEKNPFYGHTHTKETKDIIRESTARQRAKAPVLPTKPERTLHSELGARGWSYEPEHVLGKVYCVDVYVPHLNLAIFVDGCYWHACAKHFPNQKRPRSDNARIPYLTKCGYRVIVLWEHDVQENVAKALDRAIAALELPYDIRDRSR